MNIEIEMENGGIIKAELYPGRCTNHSRKFCFTNRKKLL